MSARPEAWTEAMLDELSQGEHDFQEFKGSGWVVQEGKVASYFLNALSKQVSAFANASGGRLFIGLDDEGRVDGGVPILLKKGGVRAWLEDVIPTAVEPSLRAFNVYEVTGEREGSAIEPDHAVYVVDIPASPDAPHMAGDRRYYLRIAGKSRPMGHVHIQDILRRTRHPQIEVARVGPYGRPELDETDPRGPRTFLCFQVFLINRGRTLAHHVGVEIEIPRTLVSGVVRARTLEDSTMQLTQRPGIYTFFRYHPTPIFPGQELHFARVWIGLHARNLADIRSGAAIRWRAYADDAPPTEGAKQLGDFHAVRRAIKTVEGKLRLPRKKRHRKGKAAPDQGSGEPST